MPSNLIVLYHMEKICIDQKLWSFYVQSLTCIFKIISIIDCNKIMYTYIYLYITSVYIHFHTTKQILKCQIKIIFHTEQIYILSNIQLSCKNIYTSEKCIKWFTTNKIWYLSMWLLLPPSPLHAVSKRKMCKIHYTKSTIT